MKQPLYYLVDGEKVRLFPRHKATLFAGAALIKSTHTVRAVLPVSIVDNCLDVTVTPHGAGVSGNSVDQIIVDDAINSTMRDAYGDAERDAVIAARVSVSRTRLDHVATETAREIAARLEDDLAKYSAKPAQRPAMTSAVLAYLTIAAFSLGALAAVLVVRA